MDVVTTPIQKPVLPAGAPSLHEDLAPVYARMRHVMPELEWAVHAPYIAAINALKRERNAVILAHNYQTPEIYYGIADYTGDSLGLAQHAAATEAEVIVQCGVHFMAETSKILSPDKIVLIPDAEAGCSLADSITPADIELLRRRYPGVPVVTYVNTSAAVKAASDICCTSANAREVVESLGTDRVIFLPDQYLGRWVASQTDVQIILWQGACEVHERFTGAQLLDYRRLHPGIHIIAHPECPPDVLEEADYVGSTTGMVRHIEESGAARVVMVTECSMSDNVAVQFPKVDFIRPCNLCPHMKRITLPKVLAALQTLSPAVEVDPAIAARARLAVERMLAVGRGAEQVPMPLPRQAAAG